MQRNLYVDLLAWKNSPTRKPLILQGARQVGKTYLLKYFGQHEFVNVVYLNFEKNHEIKKFFQNSLNPTEIIESISIYTEQTIIAQQTLIIFDEIQECPEALNSLKYFQEEAAEYHVVAAGSLLGVKLARAAGFPVGKVNFLDLYPLSFPEFIDALGKHKLCEYMNKINTITPILEPFHNELLMLLKKYMVIGGMPEAVLTYVNSQQLTKVRAVQEEILRAYDLDFAKHAPKEEIMRISQVWQSIPRQLAKENNKFVFSVIREGARGREYESAIQWLLEAGLIIKAYNLSVPKLPFPAYGDTNAFKVFLLDVGLLSAMSNLPLRLVATENQLFINEFNGAITENYVAQTLIHKQKPLYYWTSEATAEVDFVVEHDGNIYPLEVKAGTSRRKKSLLVYDQKFAPKLLLRASTMNLLQNGRVCNFPLYLLSEYHKFLLIHNGS